MYQCADIKKLVNVIKVNLIKFFQCTNEIILLPSHYNEIGIC